MFTFDQPRARRKPALTPLIDVVFLLLVFFMLAAQFGRTGAVPLAGSGGISDYSGPPRLVLIEPGALKLNGVVQQPQAIIAALKDMTDAPDNPIILRASAGTDLQRLSDVMGLLSEAGFERLVLAE